MYLDLLKPHAIGMEGVDESIFSPYKRTLDVRTYPSPTSCFGSMDQTWRLRILYIF
jgi:hypothetical protein